MKKYEILLNELDRCEFVFDDQYTGALADYTYNGITYEQSSYTYCQVLEAMYNDFLSEWSALSETERMSAIGKIKLIISKRYSYGDFYFDIPSSDSIDAMTYDSGVSKQSIEIARFLHDMVGLQKFLIHRVVDFLEIPLEKDVLYPDSVEVIEEQNSIDNIDIEISDTLTTKTVYQALHEKYGDTMSVKQLAEYFKVGKRTIFEWERKGYITNISTKSYETTSAGHKN